ncbi:hypothetical protein Tco_1052320 [Tanacetum coccineum]
MTSFNQRDCFGCGGAGNSFIYDPNPNSFNDPPNFFNHPPQPQFKSYSCELCGNDSHYGYDCPPRAPLVYEQEPCFNQNFAFVTFQFFYDDDDDDEESTIPLNEITSQIPPSIAITPVLPTMEPEDSLNMGYEYLSTIPEKELDEVIKSSVEDLVPISSESEDISDNDKECDLPFCDNSVTLSNPLFDANDDFTSSDDESLSEEDDIENKDFYVSNLDEPALVVTPLSDANEDECFDPGGDIDEINAFLDIDVSTDIEDGYHDSEGDIIYLECLLTNDTIPNLPPEGFLDHDPRCLKDEPDNNDLKSLVKVFDPGIHEKIISPTYVRLPFEDRHYFSLSFVIRIFLPYLTYSMDSTLLLSFGSEDTIFDPGISIFSFYSLEPVVSHRSGTFMCFNVYLNILNESPMEIYSSTCFIHNITMIWGESS